MLRGYNILGYIPDKYIYTRISRCVYIITKFHLNLLDEDCPDDA